MGRPSGSGNTARIRELLAAGRRPIEIADELGVSRERVYQINRALASEPTAERGAVRERVLPLLATQTNHQIAVLVGCAERYVAIVRAEAGIAGPRPGRAMTPAEPEDAASTAAVIELAQPFVDDAPISDEKIELDGGHLTIEPGSRGRALLTVHEHRHGASTVRATRDQLGRVIERLAAAHAAMSEAAA